MRFAREACPLVHRPGEVAPDLLDQIAFTFRLQGVELLLLRGGFFRGHGSQPGRAGDPRHDCRDAQRELRFAGDDISQRGDGDFLFFDADFRGAGAETVEPADAVDARHEIDLQAVVIADQAASIAFATAFSFRRGLSNQEIGIDGRDRRALQRSRGVADQNRFEILSAQGTGNNGENRFRVQFQIQSRITVRRLLPDF
jgi:hypothetical protein